MLDYIVMQMRKDNCEKGYSPLHTNAALQRNFPSEDQASFVTHQSRARVKFEMQGDLEFEYTKGKL